MTQNDNLAQQAEQGEDDEDDEEEGTSLDHRY